MPYTFTNNFGTGAIFNKIHISSELIFYIIKILHKNNIDIFQNIINIKTVVNKLRS